MKDYQICNEEAYIRRIDILEEEKKKLQEENFNLKDSIEFLKERNEELRLSENARYQLAESYRIESERRMENIIHKESIISDLKKQEKEIIKKVRDIIDDYENNYNVPCHDRQDVYDRYSEMMNEIEDYFKSLEVNENANTGN